MTSQQRLDSAPALFQLDNACLSYEGNSAQPVLPQLSLSINNGERVALIGKSGAGKSTLLKHLRRLQPGQAAWCPQHSGLVPMLSVYHNIYMGALQRHSTLYNLANLIRPLQKSLVEVSEIAEQLQLREQLFTSLDRLSGGQQQRTAIGRALYQRQPIFLGDEPVSALDDYQAASLLNTITHSHDTVVLALHDTEQALRVCDRVIGLKQGRIAFDKPSSAVSNSDLASLYGANLKMRR